MPNFDDESDALHGGSLFDNTNDSCFSFDGEDGYYSRDSFVQLIEDELKSASDAELIFVMQVLTGDTARAWNYDGELVTRAVIL